MLGPMCQLVKKHDALKDVGLAAAIGSNEYGELGMKVDRGSQAGPVILQHNLFQHRHLSARCTDSISNSVYVKKSSDYAPLRKTISHVAISGGCGQPGRRVFVARGALRGWARLWNGLNFRVPDPLVFKGP